MEIATSPWGWGWLQLPLAWSILFRPSLNSGRGLSAGSMVKGCGRCVGICSEESIGGRLGRVPNDEKWEVFGEVRQCCAVERQ